MTTSPSCTTQRKEVIHVEWDSEAGGNVWIESVDDGAAFFVPLTDRAAPDVFVR